MTSAPICVINAEAMGQAPLLLDSPHSWQDWPKSGTPTRVSQAALRSSCDAWVDELWALAVEAQSPVLCAQFHRAYIDANRAEDDIDPSLLDQAWPGALNPSPAGRRGMGLIRRLAMPDEPLYAQALSLADVQGRIAALYRPYHEALEQLIASAHARHGLVCHINCHSMKSTGNAMNEDCGAERPDIVVSDRLGESADPRLSAWIAAKLAALGYRVQINDPYRGAELLRRHGQPASGRHSVQIEIKRSLYMDEQAFEKRADGFQALVASLTDMVRALRAELSGSLGALLRTPSTPSIPKGDHP